MAKAKAYHVYSHLDITVSSEILATSLEDACAKAQVLQVKDFADLHGDWIDGEMHVTGVIERD